MKKVSYWLKFLAVGRVKLATISTLLIELSIALAKDAKRLVRRLRTKALSFPPIEQAYLVLKHHHGRTAGRAHNHLLNRWEWYRRWHSWKWHPHVHYSTLIAFILGLFLGLGVFRQALASDLSYVWDFLTPGDYSTSTGAEVASSKGRLKVQNYTSDANTAALYHLDEASGTSVADSSSNANTGTASTASWVAGNLNNAYSGDGSSKYISAPDSLSLSITGNNTLEAWTKFGSAFSANSHATRQPVIDKGSYQLYYDNQTGKITYELERSGATGWVQEGGGKAGGGQVKGSWDRDGKQVVQSQAAIGTSVFVGLGSYGGGTTTNAGDAEVWKWNGSTWSQVGGDGFNGSWVDDEYHTTNSLAASGDFLYAGLSTSTAGSAEVWRYNNTNNTWVKVGGDAVNGSWAVLTYETVYSLAASGTTVYAGLGNNAGDAEVWRCTTCDTSPSWSRVGGDAVNSSWADLTYERVTSLRIVGTNLVAGLGISTGDAEVWSTDTGTISWTKRGGDGSGAAGESWGTTYELVFDIANSGNTIYAGLGNTGGDSEVWSCDISATCTVTAGWTKIGGDGTGSGGQSWDTTIETVRSLAVDSSGNVYAGLGTSAGDNEVWKCTSGCTPTTGWTKIGGDSINSGWDTAQAQIDSLLIVGSDLYAGNGDQSSGPGKAAMWKTDLTTISWTGIGGRYINKSWGYSDFERVQSFATAGGKLYAGLGFTAGDGQVWEFNGSQWTMIGGQAVNSSWIADAVESISSMATFGSQVCTGGGNASTSAARIWCWNGSAWSKIGGDGLNGGWSDATAIYESASSMAAYNGNLYVGMGTSAGDADVWQWNGTTWTKVGGDSLNSGWTTGFEEVLSLTVFDGKLTAGLGNSSGDAEVWQYNGSTWSKIGGDGSGSGGQSWATTDANRVESLAVWRGKLIVGTADAVGTADVWECNAGCTTTTGWTKIGGDSLNSSWSDTVPEAVGSFAVYNGDLYAAVRGSAATEGEVWRWNGTAWTQVGDSGLGGYPQAVEHVWALEVYQGKLYAGMGDSANVDPMVWSYGDNAVLTSTTTSQDTNWHHLAATYDGNTMKLYIDGVLNNSLAANLSVPDGTQPLYIGAGHGSWGEDSGQPFLTGSLDEVRISNTVRTSFTTKPYSTVRETVRPTSAVFPTGVATWDSFATSETLGGGTANYRLSSDGGSTWKYWNGSIWATSNSLTDANPPATINSNIATFPVTSSGLLWQAILLGNGDQQVTINSVTITATSDTQAPNNPASVTAKDSASGSVTLTSDNWYNYTAPYFSWSAPSDPPSGSGGVSGVSGYYVYFGTDSTADPFTAGTFQTATNFTAGSLTSGNTYFLRIKTKDVAGNVSSTAAALFTYKFDSVAPAAVEFVNVSPVGCSTASTFNFSWPASSDGSSGISGYEYKLGSTGSISFNADLDVDAPPYQVGDNVFYVRAKDVAGNTSVFVTGIYCSTETATVVDGPSVVAGPSSLTVSWTSSKATTSFVRVQEGNTYISEQGQSSFSISHTVKVVGLEPEKTYKYKLVWTDSAGNLGETPFFETATSTAPATKNLDAQILSPTAVLLSWQTTELSSANIEYGIGNFASTKTLSGSATSFTQQLTGLSAGNNYQARIAARTQDGYPYFSVITFQTPPLPKISDLRFDYLPSAQATVQVSWSTNVPSTSLVRYTPSGGETLVASSAELVTEHAVTLEELQDNASYQIVAVSTDQYGNSGVSDVQTYATPFDTRAPKISNLNVEVKSSGVGSSQKAQIVISWETDEPATGQIEYGPGIASEFYPSRSQEDRTLSTTHVIIVSNLDPAKLYHLRAVSKDRSGNTGNSVDTTAITGKVQRSVIDLIINALERSLNFLTRLPLVGR